MRKTPSGVIDTHAVITDWNRRKQEQPPAILQACHRERDYVKNTELRHCYKQLLVSIYPGSLESEISIKLVLYKGSGLSDGCETGYAQTVTGLAIHPDILLFR